MKDSQANIILVDSLSVSNRINLLPLTGEKDLPIIPLDRTEGKFSDVL